MQVLIIDDDPSLRDVLQSLLQSAGYAVTAAANGADGVRIALAIRPAIIFCDIQMPGMGGYEVVRELKKHARTKDTPLIFTSALNAQDSRPYAMSLGATGYIEKPFKQDDIVRAITTYVKAAPAATAAETQATGAVAKSSAPGHPTTHTPTNDDSLDEIPSPVESAVVGIERIEASIHRLTTEEICDSLSIVRGKAEEFSDPSRKLFQIYELERIKSLPSKPQWLFDDIVSAAKAVASRLASEAGRKEDLRFSCAGGEIALPESLLRIALGEIIDNAFRYSLKGDTVTVTGFLSSNRYAINVTDQGRGMTAEEAANTAFFKKFGRDPFGRRHGLGLTLTRLIAEVSGGALVIQPAGLESKGLEVTLSIPLVDADQA